MHYLFAWHHLGWNLKTDYGIVIGSYGAVVFLLKGDLVVHVTSSKILVTNNAHNKRQFLKCVLLSKPCFFKSSIMYMRNPINYTFEYSMLHMYWYLFCFSSRILINTKCENIGMLHYISYSDCLIVYSHQIVVEYEGYACLNFLFN